MNLADYQYQLPDELIAQFPPAERTGSRLLVLHQDASLEDRQLSDIVDYLHDGDLLVLNDTRVIPARLHAQKETGGRVEIMLERITGENQVLAQLRASRAPKPGQRLIIDGDEHAKVLVTGRQGSFFELEFEVGGALLDWFERVGHMPLPPYINRQDQADDSERYQTVFAERHGAVAAPTAGLHYDEELLAKISALGVRIAKITLHVGAGTYQPVRVEQIEQHQMHSEWIEVSAEVCEQIRQTKAAGGRVVAVGTTVVRALESAAQASLASPDGPELQPFSGETDIFIYPGYRFEVVDLLQTNFHLPESTLLMLIAAFAGHAAVMNAYQHAIEQRYRFFSYGDAMLLERSKP